MHLAAVNKSDFVLPSWLIIHNGWSVQLEVKMGYRLDSWHTFSLRNLKVYVLLMINFVTSYWIIGANYLWCRTTEVYNVHVTLTAWISLDSWDSVWVYSSSIQIMQWPWMVLDRCFRSMTLISRNHVNSAEICHKGLLLESFILIVKSKQIKVNGICFFHSHE